MKRQVVVLGLFIIAVCVVSLIPFSNQKHEGFDANANVSSVSASNQPDASAAQLPTTPITSNEDFMTAVNQALNAQVNPTADKSAIQNIQTRISGLSSRNANTILGEIGNPNNTSNPRAFLKYLNWFASNCPINSDTCAGAQ